MNKPNFIVFLTDDQGYGDLSCMGATDFRTPHLDCMAANGVRFSNWYSNSILVMLVCAQFWQVIELLQVCQLKCQLWPIRLKSLVIIRLCLVNGI